MKTLTRRIELRYGASLELETTHQQTVVVVRTTAGAQALQLNYEELGRLLLDVLDARATQLENGAAP